MKRQIQTFFTVEDEFELSRMLNESSSELHFLDDNVWDGTPKVEAGIQACASGRAYLYPGRLADLPTRARSDGALEGPIVGCVVQVLRCRLLGDVLQSGRIAASSDDEDSRMLEFISKVWKLAKRIGRLGVVRPDGRLDKSYLLGSGARRAVLDGELIISDRSVGIYYRVPE